MKIGEKYWCCEQSVENLSYGDNSPQKPWIGILSNKNGVFYLNRFDENDIIDDDTNARTFVEENKIFLTEEEAIKYYKKRCVIYASSLQDMVNYYRNESL